MPALAAEASGAGSAKAQSLVRVLQATHYVENFKTGVRQVVHQSGKTNPLLQAVLKTDNAKLNEIFATVYARHLSLAQAQKVRQFYESATGRALIAAQMQHVNDPHPELDLSQAQLLKVKAFTDTDAAKAFAQAARDKSIWDELGKALKDELSTAQH